MNMLKRKLQINKVICLVLCILILGAVLCGCRRKSDEISKEDKLTFTDSLGRGVTVTKNPERVAALIGSFAEVWQLSGGKLCATAEDAWEDFDLELADCTNIGGAHSPNLEVLLSANPDFVLASSSTSSNVEMMDALEGAGITVAYFNVDNFEDYLHMLDICTDITGKKELYEENGLKIKNEIDSVKNSFLKANVPQHELSVILLRASSGSVKAKGSEGTVLGEMLRDLGCRNIADTEKILLENLSVESVIRQNPYHVFVVTMGDDKKAIESLEKLFADNPAWNSLDAVKENRLHIMDRKMFNIKPNADWAKSYEKLSEILLGNSQ